MRICAWNLIFCLRLAVLLHRTRDDRAIPAWRAVRSENGFVIELPADWLAANPLTAAAFGEEATVWMQLGREYVLRSKPARKIA